MARFTWAVVAIFVVAAGGCHRSDTRVKWGEDMSRCIESVHIERARDPAQIASLKPLAAWAARTVDPEIARAFRSADSLDYDEALGSEVASFRELIGAAQFPERGALECKGEFRNVLIDVIGDKLYAAGQEGNTGLEAQFRTLELDSYESRLAMKFALVLELRGQAWTEAGLARVVRKGRAR
jgi:hypothetical protein